MAEPMKPHLMAARNILKYVKSTSDMGLLYGRVTVTVRIGGGNCSVPGVVFFQGSVELAVNNHQFCSRNLESIIMCHPSNLKFRRRRSSRGMQIRVKCNCGEGECREWAIIEGNYTFTIGYHELSGTKMHLKRPFLVLRTKKVETVGDSNSSVELHVVGIIRHRILFKTRPKALISNVTFEIEFSAGPEVEPGGGAVQRMHCTVKCSASDGCVEISREFSFAPRFVLALK
ncbi:hypothetical protein KSP40_PGU010323 [Platanthera guangdongensis]|uniref:Uncharacterized protein n=1 Tax=Platanthera guangdongensis TaxID=2320717 RepID=A0ABR2LM01_9ASPA